MTGRAHPVGKQQARGNSIIGNENSQNMIQREYLLKTCRIFAT